MTQQAAPVCMCPCHNARGIDHPNGVDVTDPFHHALACEDCVIQHDTTLRIEPTAWNPDEDEA